MGTTAEYVLNKLANRYIDDTKFTTEICDYTDFLNCVLYLNTKYQGKKTWFNLAPSGDYGPSKHLVYHDATNSDYIYEITIYMRGIPQTDCCVQNPVIQVLCIIEPDTYHCISVSRIPRNEDPVDDQVPTIVLDDAVNALFDTTMRCEDYCTEFQDRTGCYDDTLSSGIVSIINSPYYIGVVQSEITDTEVRIYLYKGGYDQSYLIADDVFDLGLDKKRIYDNNGICIELVSIIQSTEGYLVSFVARYMAVTELQSISIPTQYSYKYPYCSDALYPPPCYDGQQLRAICKDTNGSEITCPSLTWSSDNDNISINQKGCLSSTTDNATANIKAYDYVTGIESNNCVVTSTYTGKCPNHPLNLLIFGTAFVGALILIGYHVLKKKH